VTAIEVVPRSPEPEIPDLEVTLVPDDAPEATVAAPGSSAAALTRGERGPRRPAADASATGATTARPPGTDEPGPASPLAMRGLRHDLSLSGEAAARIADGGAPRNPVQPSGKILPNGREGRINDSVASYAVHSDGTVDIHSKKDIDVHLLLPIPTPSRIRRGLHELGDDLDDWRKDPYRDTRVGRTQDLPAHLQAVPGACDTFGDVMCDANPPRRLPLMNSLSGDGFIVPVLGGRLDITSYLQHKFVGDPFASRKLKMLDATRDERVASGTAHRAAQLARSAELMARNLEALGRATADPAVRREALFELWDECGEGEGPAGAAGERARAMVIGWIRAHLPSGEAGAFSADDIARLDARRSSKQHFVPY
jgi:hypothetical protein